MAIEGERERKKDKKVKIIELIKRSIDMTYMNLYKVMIKLVICVDGKKIYLYIRGFSSPIFVLIEMFFFSYI